MCDAVPLEVQETSGHVHQVVAGLCDRQTGAVAVEGDAGEEVTGVDIGEDLEVGGGGERRVRPLEKWE